MDVALAKPIRSSRHLIIVGVGAIVLVLLLLTAWPRGRLPSDEAFRVVTSGPLELEALGIGELVSAEEVVLGAPGAGVIAEVLHRSGDPVDAGALIFRLHDPALGSALQASEIQLERAQLDAEIAVQDVIEVVEESEEAVQTAVRQLDVARSELQAMIPLSRRGAVSALDLVRAKARAADAEGAMLQAERRLDRARAALARQRALQERFVDLAKGEYDRLQAQWAALHVRAPVAGVLKAIQSRPGEMVTSGQVLGAVGPVHPDGARLRFPPQFLAGIRPGLPLIVRYPGAEVHGTLTRVDPVLQNGYVSAEATLVDLPDSARVGLTVRATASLAQAGLPRLQARAVAGDAPESQWAELWRRRNGETLQIAVSGIERIGDIVVFPLDTSASVLAPGDQIAFVNPAEG
jgi:HlyD family secretion protein